MAITISNILLLPSISVPLFPSISFPLPVFALFLCSRHNVAPATTAAPTAAPTAADDYDDMMMMSMNIICRPLLTLCWIPKSIFAVSTSSIDVSYSPLLTVSKIATPEAIQQY